jgi:peptide deformylase
MTMRITQYGESVLRQQGEPVTDFGNRLARLAEAMFETMYAAEGIGLAAQQVGLALQFCVVDVRPPEGEQAQYFYELDGKRPPPVLFMPLAMANPEVEFPKRGKSDYEEGCLSFPNIRATIRRHSHIKVRFQDVDGLPHVLECDGLLARCILHEVDHLNGVLFIDHLSKKDQRKLEPDLRRLKAVTRAKQQK